MHTRSTMRRGRYATLLAAVLVAGAFTEARAAPPDTGVNDVMLVLDVGGLESELAGRLGPALIGRLREALREDGVTVVGDAVESRVEVRVAMADVELHSYVISVAVTMDAKRELVADKLSCMACSEARVVELTLEQLPDAVLRLRQPEPVVAPAPAIVPDKRERRSRSGLGVDRRLNIGPLGFTGAASVVGGLASVGAGVLLLTLPREASDNAAMRHAGSIGGAFVVVGGAAALLGVVAAVVDAQVLGTRRRAFFGVDVSVEASATNAGLWMTGRF